MVKRFMEDTFWIPKNFHWRYGEAGRSWEGQIYYFSSDGRADILKSTFYYDNDSIWLGEQSLTLNRGSWQASGDQIEIGVKSAKIKVRETSTESVLKSEGTGQHVFHLTTDNLLISQHDTLTLAKNLTEKTKTFLKQNLSE